MLRALTHAGLSDVPKRGERRFQSGARRMVCVMIASVDRLLEQGSGRVVSADKGTRRIVVEIIEAGMGNARDRRLYEGSTLARDHKIFDGRKMFSNHLTPDEEKRLAGRPRDIRDLTGRIIETRWNPTGGKNGRGAIEGVVSVSAPWLWDLVEHDPELVELSINAFGKTRRATGPDGKPAHLVEAITRCDSVDWVAAGGAGGRVVSFLESLIKEPTGMADISELTIEELREARPDLVIDIEHEFTERILEGDEDLDTGGEDAEGDEDVDTEEGDEDAAQEGELYTRSEVEKIVREAAERVERTMQERFDDAERVRMNRDIAAEMIESARLPQMSAKILREEFHDFDGTESDLRAIVTQAVDEKRRELREAGGRIRGNGVSKHSMALSESGGIQRTTTTAHEDILASLGIKES